MSEFDHWRKKIKREIEKTYDIDEESDFPVHEHYTKEQNFVTAKKDETKRKMRRG